MRQHNILTKIVLFYLFALCQSVFLTSAHANISNVDNSFTVNEGNKTLNSQVRIKQGYSSQANGILSAQTATQSATQGDITNKDSLVLVDISSKTSTDIDLLANAIRAARQSQNNDNSSTSNSLINPELSTITVNDDLEGITDNPSLSRNQLSIGEALKQACRITQSQVLLNRCAEIGALNNLEQTRVLNTLIQDESAGTVTRMLRIGSTQFNNINKRIRALKSGQWGLVSLNHLSLNIEGKAVPIGTIAQGLLNSASGRSVGDNIARSERLGLYLNGKLSFGKKKSTKQQTGFDFDTQGVTLGMDYRFSDQFVAGAALGHAFTDTNYNNKGGTESRASSINLYGSYYLPQNFYLDLVSHFGYHASDNTRSIRYGDFSGKANSDTNGVEYGVNFSLGKHWGFNSWIMNPYARFEYLEVLINNYSETSLSGLAISIDHTGGRSVKSVLGTQISKVFGMPKGIIKPSINFEWLHEFKANATNVSGHFLDSSRGTGRFKLVADAPDHDFFNIGASVKAIFSEGRNISLNHTSRLGQAGIKHYRFKLGVNIPF
jgi:uncharacterized protein YhjY with autotransporter beta-barrel domain